METNTSYVIIFLLALIALILMTITGTFWILGILIGLIIAIYLFVKHEEVFNVILYLIIVVSVLAIANYYRYRTCAFAAILSLPAGQAGLSKDIIRMNTNAFLRQTQDKL